MTDAPTGPDPELEPEAPTTAPLRRSRGEVVGSAVASFMGGIEQQVFQRRPPAIELVRQPAPVRGVTGDGRELTVVLPDQPSDRVP
jgi:hypothetical protein